MTASREVGSSRLDSAWCTAPVRLKPRVADEELRIRI